VDLLSEIQRPFVIGIFIAGIITYFFPDNLTHWANEHKLLAMLVMLVTGIPMYVCATASTPIAAALILKGLNPGAALVFLLAGPATNAATMGVVKKIFNTRALGIYLVTISVCSLMMGFALDSIYALLDIEARAVIGQASEIVPYSVQLVCAIVLAVIMISNGLRQVRHSRAAIATR
jgi:uncharacterized membrane protein YraQ (UPF0718 family)